MINTKKRFIKMFVAAAVAALVMAMCVPVWATEADGAGTGDVAGEVSGDVIDETGDGTEGTVVSPALLANLDLDEEGTIQVQPRYNGAGVTSGKLSLYKLADVELLNNATEMSYSVTEEFANLDSEYIKTIESISCDDDSSVYTDSEMLEAIAAYITENGIEALDSQTSTEDSHGYVKFEGVTAGLYLVVQTEAADGYYAASPFLITFPATVTASDGTVSWDYDIDASVKMELTPIPETPEEEIPEDVPPEEVTPEETPETPTETTTVTTPEKLPQTGQLKWPIPVLMAAGIALFFIGFTINRMNRKQGGQDI